MSLLMEKRDILMDSKDMYNQISFLMKGKMRNKATNITKSIISFPR
jgi:hypothetical protein